MSKAHFGLIGLGVMGENLVLNAERNGFSSVLGGRDEFCEYEEWRGPETEDCGLTKSREKKRTRIEA